MFVSLRKTYRLKPKYQSVQFISQVLSPGVRRLVIEYNVKPDQIKSSGSKNNLLKGDVLRHIKEKNLNMDKGRTLGAWPTASQSHPKEPLPAAERRTPTIMSSSNKNVIPHQYISMEFQADNLLKFIKLTNDNQIQATREDVLLKCAALGMKEVKEVNVHWNGAEAVPNPSISIGIKNMDGKFYEIDGADLKGLQTISEERKKLLESEDLSPIGSLCIYDFGTLGVSSFTPIVKAPQVAVIAIGGERQKLVIDSNSNLTNQTTSLVSMSFDARSVDFENASKFLLKLISYFENPKHLLL